MLISMQQHVQEQRVLVVVESKGEHLIELRVVDAEPGQRLRVGYVRRRVLRVREVEESHPIWIVKRFVCTVVG